MNFVNMCWLILQIKAVRASFSILFSHYLSSSSSPSPTFTLVNSGMTGTVLSGMIGTSGMTNGSIPLGMDGTKQIN